MATDLAEFVGAAIALNLLFGVPLFAAGLITAVVAFAILGLQTRGYRRFETTIAGLLGGHPARVPLRGAALRRGRWGRGRRLHPRVRRHREHPAGHGHPRRDRDAARDLPALRAHAEPDQAARRRRAPRAAALRAPRRGDRHGYRGAREHVDADRGRGALPRRSTDVDTIEGPTRASRTCSGPGAAVAFGLALLASGLSSSSVGTYAGQVVMQGFIQRSIPLLCGGW